MAVCDDPVYGSYEVVPGVWVPYCGSQNLNYGAEAYIGSASSVGIGMTQADFVQLSSWALTLFVLAFGIKAIRKRLAPNL